MLVKVEGWKSQSNLIKSVGHRVVNGFLGGMVIESCPACITPYYGSQMLNDGSQMLNDGSQMLNVFGGSSNWGIPWGELTH